jgi:hypothetical protein
VPELLQPLVDRRRGSELGADGSRQLGRRLLAELAEPLGRAFEARSLGRNRVGQEAHRETDHNRLDAGLEQADPGAGAEHEVDEAEAHRDAPANDHDEVEADRGEERCDLQVLRVHGCDDDQRGDVVDDQQGEHVGSQPVGKAPAQECE